MRASDFCYWLQGYIEISRAGLPAESVLALTPGQAETIERHLAMVFFHDIDPKSGPPEVQEKLQAIHDGLAEAGSRPDHLPHARPLEVQYRC
jgi:hypothetical protein